MDGVVVNKNDSHIILMRLEVDGLAIGGGNVVADNGQNSG
jgi:hypothetical protein